MAQNNENVVAFYGGRRINASEWYQSLIEDIDSEVDVSFENLHLFLTVLTNY